MEKITPKLWSWASIVEEQARVQAIKTAHMDIVQPHMAIMPDIHFGKGCCVGAVVPTVRAIMPAVVGVDIGCGMIALRTQFTKDDLEGKDLSVLREAVEQAIPLSAGGYNSHLHNRDRKFVEELEGIPGAGSAYDVSPNWPLQLKSLGSGNHFIEVTVDEGGRVWLFLHSGSRGVGNKLATMHIRKAQDACQGVSLPDRDLAYLVQGTPEFADYIRDLQWAQQFALLNRQAMMNELASCFEQWTGTQLRPDETINCHHNYTVTSLALSEQAGEQVWLSRKGAIDAHEGVMGLIPGSMSTASYVVEGKGNADALWSSPHGAGRLHSRGSAKRAFTEQDVIASMDGIEFNRSRAVKFTDEISSAYKDVDQVMMDAADLVTVRHTFRQILNVKGD